MPFITYPQADGQVVVIIPADLSMSIEEIAAKDVPAGLPYKIVESLDMDDSYFNAYEFSADAGAEINISKAQLIHLDKFRTARTPLLAKLDVDYMRALEVEDSLKASQIAIAKQELRDVTKTPLPDTLPEIKEVWPAILN
jgi:transcription elongation factor GreA-like protein